ncbi:MAG: hypothetical protein DME90_05735 [Verrucomicrobia bacterium]|nr:MAG: hypothetical protein DME90_05735 [Verrucomicrobiota bacterium]
MEFRGYAAPHEKLPNRLLKNEGHAGLEFRLYAVSPRSRVKRGTLNIEQTAFFNSLLNSACL